MVRIGGSVWESNPPSVPRRYGTPALKAGKTTGPLSPPGGLYGKKRLAPNLTEPLRFARFVPAVGSGRIRQNRFGADFVVSAAAGRTAFSVRQKLAHITFAYQQRLERVAHGHQSGIERNAFAAPGENAAGFRSAQGNFLAQLQKPFFVELHAIEVVA